MRGRITLLAGLALAGGIAAVVGSVLSWAELSFGPISEQARGIEGWEGKAAMVGGLIMLVPGVSAFVAVTEAGARLRAALIGGLIAAGVGTYTALTVDDQMLGAVAEAGVPMGIVREAIASGLLKVTLEAGLFVVIAGGALGVIAGVLAFGVRAAVPRMPTGGSGATGLTGWAAPAGPKTSGATPRSPWIPPPPGEGPGPPDR